MEELKQIVELLKDAPDKIIWLIAMYFFFKLFVVGSIYGIGRLIVKAISEVLSGVTASRVEISHKEERIKEKATEGELKIIEANREKDREARKIQHDAREQKRQIDREQTFLSRVDKLMITSDMDSLIELLDYIKGDSNYIHASDINEVLTKLKATKDA